MNRLLRYGMTLIAAAGINAAVMRYDATGNLGPNNGASCPARPAPCVFVVSCATGTCTNTERIQYQAVADTETHLGDTLKFQAGHLFPSYNAVAALELGGRPGSGYLTITTTEDDKLPAADTRITPAFRPLMPTFRADTSTSSAIALKGTSAPAEHMIIRGVRMIPKEGQWAVVWTRGLLAIGNNGLTWGFCDGAYCPVSGNVKGAYAGPGNAIRLTVRDHPWSTGDTIIVAAIPGIPALASLSAWKMTAIDADTIELDGSQFSGSFPGTGSAGRQELFRNIAYQPDDVLVQHILMEQEHFADSVRAGIILNARGVTIRDSWVDGIQTGDGEAKAISSINAEGPFTITNNYLSSAGENVFFGGGRPSTFTTPSNITIRHNSVPKRPEQWRRRRWSPGLLVFRGAIIYTNTNTGAMLNTTYIALNTGRTGAVEPGDAAAGGAASWPSMNYSTVAGCSYAPGAATCVQDGEVVWAKRGAGYWQVKNNFECKACINVLIEHNVFDGNWIDGQDAMINIKTSNQCLGSKQDRVTRRTGVVNTSPVGDGKTRLTWVSGDKLPFLATPNPANDPNVFQIFVGGVARTIDSSPLPGLTGKAGFVSEDQLIINEDLGTQAGLTFVHGRNSGGANPLDMTDSCFESKTQNVTFRNNIVRNGPVGLKTFLGTNSQVGNLRDISITNNLFHNIDRCVWSNLYSGSGCSSKWDLAFLSPVPNMTFENNTVLSTSGSAVGPYMTIEPQAAIRANLPGSIRNNILLKGSTAGIKGGGQAEGAASLEILFCGAACPPEKFNRNIIAGANAAVYYGLARTTTFCPTSTASCYGSGSVLSGLRQLMRDYDHGNYRIRTDSPAGRNAGTNGRDLGADHSKLAQILNPRVQTTATQAVFLYEVSAPAVPFPCVAHVSGSPDLYQTIPDLNPGAASMSEAPKMNSDAADAHPGTMIRRSIVVGARSPLTPATEYHYILMCGGAALTGKFTTAEAADGQTAMAVERRTRAASMTVEFGYAYDRRTDTILNAAAVTETCSYPSTCKAELSVNRSSLVFYRWADKDVGGNTTARGPVQIGAVR